MRGISACVYLSSSPCKPSASCKRCEYGKLVPPAFVGKKGLLNDLSRAIKRARMEHSFPQQELLAIQVSFFYLFLLQREIEILEAF